MGRFFRHFRPRRTSGRTGVFRVRSIFRRYMRRIISLVVLLIILIVYFLFVA